MRAEWLMTWAMGMRQEEKQFGLLDDEQEQVTKAEAEIKQQLQNTHLQFSDLGKLEYKDGTIWSQPEDGRADRVLADMRGWGGCNTTPTRKSSRMKRAEKSADCGMKGSTANDRALLVGGGMAQHMARARNLHLVVLVLFQRGTRVARVQTFQPPHHESQ